MMHGIYLFGATAATGLNYDITPADNYDNLFILWFRLDFRVFNFIMVKNFFNF
jgi:hypothetical protein